MAKRWSEVIQNPRYQQLSDEEKEAKRAQYFEEVVKPRIKPEQYNDMWGKFINDAYQMEGVKKQPEAPVIPEKSLDDKISELESTVKPEPGILETINNKFTDSPDESAQRVLEH